MVTIQSNETVESKETNVPGWGDIRVIGNMGRKLQRFCFLCSEEEMKLSTLARSCAAHVLEEKRELPELEGAALASVSTRSLPVTWLTRHSLSLKCNKPYRLKMWLDKVFTQKP